MLLDDSTEGEHSGGSPAVEAPKRGKGKVPKPESTSRPFPFAPQEAMSGALGEKTMDQDSGAVRDNPSKSRFELTIDGSTALADYVIRDGVMIFTHTETPPALQGRGVASRLIRGALLLARDQGRKVGATCSFVVAYLERHPEFSDLLP